MKFPVCPELPTASVGSSQAPPAAVDNSAPSAIRPESTYKSGNVVQTNGATSQRPVLIFGDATGLQRPLPSSSSLAASLTPSIGTERPFSSNWLRKH